MKKKNGVTTGVPAGKVNKDISYDLAPFIIGGSRGNDLSIDDQNSIASNDAVDEEFMRLFTLSKFRKDLMLIAIDKFPEEYKLETKSLGPKCKLFLQKQWNMSSWTEVTSTEMFHRIVFEQMENRSRTNQMRISFGRAKAGLEFKSQSDVDEYTAVSVGDANFFSQNEIPSSPYIRTFGSVKRDANWNRPARIAELLATTYKTSSCKLYYGFLKEHGNTFYRIISAHLSLHKDASIYLPTFAFRYINCSE